MALVIRTVGELREALARYHDSEPVAIVDHAFEEEIESVEKFEGIVRLRVDRG